jgi:tripartite-type tricarboxylate transporter receptor subunit TctC
MRTRLRWYALSLACLVVVSALAPSAGAQTYPSGPVKVIVPAAAGGSIDVIARMLADRLARLWGQQVLVLNHPGGGTSIGARAAATSPADGYTLFFGISSTFVALPVLQPNLPFDIGRDFVPIGFVGEQPMVVAADPALGISSLKELVALARQRPGGLNCAVTQNGGLAHLTGLLLRQRAGIELTFIHYPGTAQSVNDVIAGRVPMVVDGLPGFLGAIAGGKLKPLAVAASRRLPNFPDLPIAADAVGEFAASGWFAMMAPAGTPAAIAEKVANDLNEVLGTPELKQKLEELGTYPRPMSPGELRDFILREQAMWKPLVQESGIRAQ